MSELEFSEVEATEIYKFFLKLIEKIGSLCQLARDYSPEYFETNSANKLLYLASYKIAFVHSLQ